MDESAYATEVIGAAAALLGVGVVIFRAVRRRVQMDDLLSRIDRRLGPDGMIGRHFGDDDRPGALPSLPRQVADLRSNQDSITAAFTASHERLASDVAQLAQDLRDHMKDEERWRAAERDELSGMIERAETVLDRVETAQRLDEADATRVV